MLYPSPGEEEFQQLLARLPRRDAVRSEATVQADVRQLLLTGGFNLAEHDLEVNLETHVAGHNRIDVEVGCTVIEVKKDLRSKSILANAEKQLCGYVAARAADRGQRYVGILTDGADWRGYHLVGDELSEATQFTLNPSKPDKLGLLSWLEGIMATSQGVKPTPEEIRRLLGADSAAHDLDRADLVSLYVANKEMPTVQLKRQLWGQLLRSALGTQFDDDDALFVEHTLLVNSAEIIAHLILGLDVTEIAPASILRGQLFQQARIFGVVEQDFFDWVLEVPGGDSLVRTMTRRLARFNWRKVEHDVLKVLYESVIGAETRKSLGEYYTPDWLAEHIVATAVTDPLKQRVLDPSCGSGTFLFHAARLYLDAAEAADTPLASALEGLTDHVAGIDLHPVAVALARVTYLLAIGQERLTSHHRGVIRIPVFLGDSVQWQQRMDLLDHDHLVIPTGVGNQLFEDELRFPDRLLADADRFDRIVSELADLATRETRAPGSAPVSMLTGMYNRLAILPEDRDSIAANFGVLCRLVDDGRNHIWSYYVRNLARPMWLARQENRVDILVGNPPWLSYRHMPSAMQIAFKQLSQERELWHGNESATHQDLSGLFVARAIEQYLANGGEFAFIMPNAVLDRPYFRGFRSGHYKGGTTPASVAFTGSWDLRRLRPHFFPRGCAVVFGRRTGQGQSTALPVTSERWTGRVPAKAQGWSQAASCFTREPSILRLVDEGLVESPYEKRFNQGATLVPKVLFFVRERDAGPLGTGGARTAVISERTSYEKAPWKDLPALEGIVESEFIRPVLLGENILPYRVLPACTAVLPLEGNSILDGDSPSIDQYPGLADWWRKAESVWITHRRSERLSLAEQANFRRKLTAQIPAASLRFVYAASAMHVAAAVVDDPTAIIEHGLYWGTVTSRAEGMYLCAIFNTPVLTDLVRPLMSYGKDERHIDKSIWKLPIPLFDPTLESHRRLAEIGALEAADIANLDINESANFISLRRRLRESLSLSERAEELEQLVVELLDQ